MSHTFSLCGICGDDVMDDIPCSSCPPRTLTPMEMIEEMGGDNGRSTRMAAEPGIGLWWAELMDYPIVERVLLFDTGRDPAAAIRALYEKWKAQ